ncbi:MAG: hypothetical protein Q9213_004199 [Squamulea squamosa]
MPFHHIQFLQKITDAIALLHEIDLPQTDIAQYEKDLDQTVTLLRNRIKDTCTMALQKKHDDDDKVRGQLIQDAHELWGRFEEMLARKTAATLVRVVLEKMKTGYEWYGILGQLYIDWRLRTV